MRQARVGDGRGSFKFLPSAAIAKEASGAGMLLTDDGKADEGRIWLCPILVSIMIPSNQHRTNRVCQRQLFSLKARTRRVCQNRTAEACVSDSGFL